MGTEKIIYCIVALLLGMLLANMLKNVCGCNNIVEGQAGADGGSSIDDGEGLTCSYSAFTEEQKATLGVKLHNSGMIDGCKTCDRESSCKSGGSWTGQGKTKTFDEILSTYGGCTWAELGLWGTENDMPATQSGVTYDALNPADPLRSWKLEAGADETDLIGYYMNRCNNSIIDTSYATDVKNQQDLLCEGGWKPETALACETCDMSQCRENNFATTTTPRGDGVLTALDCHVPDEFTIKYKTENSNLEFIEDPGEDRPPLTRWREIVDECSQYAALNLAKAEAAGRSTAVFRAELGMGSQNDQQRYADFAAVWDEYRRHQDTGSRWDQNEKQKRIQNIMDLQKGTYIFLSDGWIGQVAEDTFTDESEIKLYNAFKLDGAPVPPHIYNIPEGTYGMPARPRILLENILVLKEDNDIFKWVASGTDDAAPVERVELLPASRSEIFDARTGGSFVHVETVAAPVAAPAAADVVPAEADGEGAARGGWPTNIRACTEKCGGQFPPEDSHDQYRSCVRSHCSH